MLIAKDLQNMDDAKLNKLLSETRKKHYLLKIGVRTKHLKNSQEAKQNQKDIARILTEMNRRKDQAPKQAEKVEVKTES